jgi:PAS domain S-box-containing protein
MTWEVANMVRKGILARHRRSMIKVHQNAKRRRREYREALGEQANLTIEVIEAMFDGYLSMDLDWRCLYVNERGARLLGRDIAELVGADIRTTIPHSVEDGFWARVETVMATKVAFEVNILCAASGRWLDVRCSRSSLGVWFFFTDITARKAAEAEREVMERNLAEARDRLSLALHSAAMGLEFVD